MRWIYISPHLDDAVLSCGGLIYEQSRQGIHVETWTICAGDAPPGELSPLIQVIHFQWGTTTTEETVHLRSGEDDAAAALVGAHTCRFSIPDCIYRRSVQGELLYTQDIFGPRHPLDEELPAEIASALREELLPGDVIVCPLTIGGHIDHIIVREAVESLHLPLLYYADIPYLFRHPEALPPAVQGLEEQLYTVSAEGLLAWQDGVAAYRSQMAVLFETEGQMRQALQNHWEVGKTARLWR